MGGVGTATKLAWYSSNLHFMGGGFFADLIAKQRDRLHGNPQCGGQCGPRTRQRKATQDAAQCV